MKIRNNHLQTNRHATIKEVMSMITHGVGGDSEVLHGIVLVVDSNSILEGVVTDGDIRRALLSGFNLDVSVGEIMTTDPITIESDVPVHNMLPRVFEQIRARNIPYNAIDKVILVDDQRRPTDVYSFFELWKMSEVKTRRVGVIGLGYVGLTLALTLAEVGFEVIGVDIKESVVAQLRTGKSHFFEKGLDELLQRHIDNRFIVTSEFQEGVSDVYIICVGTPVDDTNTVQMQYLESSLKVISKILKPNDLIVLRSTVPIGTCRNFVIPILERETDYKAGRDFFVAFAPERTAEGVALQEIRSIPQVIGGYDKASSDLAANLFKEFVRSIRMVSTLEAAEAVKLVNNTYRDLTFAYSNELSQVMDGFSLNTYEVIEAANLGYPRNNIPVPSPGVGGACLTKDPFIFMKSSESISYTPKLPIVGRDINESMISFVAQKVITFLRTHKRGVTDPKIFIMGLAFKGQPETSDLRSSTGVEIMQEIQKEYKNIYVHDPVVADEELQTLDVTPTSVENGFMNADCVVVLNNHHSFYDLGIYSLVKTLARPSLLFDGWAIFVDFDFQSIDHVHYDGLGIGAKYQL